MYLEGLGFGSIGRILKISYGTVYQWVKEWGSKVSLPQSEEPVVLVELDEMHTYVGSKNYCWVWIAVNRFAKRFLSFVCGSRGTETGIKLYNNLKYREIAFYYTDQWKCYEEILQSEFHIRIKAETYTIEEI